MVVNGNIIRKIRKSKGISQEEAADFLDISQTAYSKLENNITKLSAERISLLSHLFKVEEKDFFNSPENINLENNSLQFEHISNLLKSQQDIFDEQKELLQETINILKLQLDECNKQIETLLSKLNDT
ncbi:MAG: helix-turn-helix domain-containing protein [Bacteroidota bacterium]